MVQVIKSNERGHANHGWLDSYHTFSFADYYNPAMMGFRDLRVINEDTVDGGTGFGTHGHRDMEIITIVTEGALEHKDTLGNTAVIRPGEVQRMSAGTGVRHSEFSVEEKGKKTHLLQIWILPDKEGHEPGYEQKDFSEAVKKQNLTLVVSEKGELGSLKINQNAKVYLGRLNQGENVSYEMIETRHAWVQVIEGELELNKNSLSKGDGAAVSRETALQLSADSDAKFIVFDLA